MPDNQHYPASIAVLEYNARSRRQDTANANEFWRASFAGEDWPLALTYSQAAEEHDRAVEALRDHAALVAVLEAAEAMRDGIRRGMPHEVGQLAVIDALDRYHEHRALSRPAEEATHG